LAAWKTDAIGMCTGREKMYAKRCAEVT